MTRLFVDCALIEHNLIELDSGQSHYLSSVLRKKKGAEILLFNGKDGGFLGVIETTGKHSLTVRCKRQLVSQTRSSDLWLIFVPIKRTRMDFMVQKATELGVSKIWPVQSKFGQVKKIREGKLRANMIEAAEQTERCDLPEIGKFMPLQNVLDNWPKDRVLVFCDETQSDAGQGRSMLQLNRKLKQKAAILIGPEGGFSALEREHLHVHPMCEIISLGPRILRSDTAAIAALSIFQSNFGDWYKTPADLNDEEQN